MTLARDGGAEVAASAIQCMAVRRIRTLLGTLIAVILVTGLAPRAAQAHTGPANPVASSYEARITALPAGIQARVLGGDLRMWMSVDSPETVVVLDYHGAPYLRFSRSGVFVNTHSWMYYLNQPTPLTPPANLSPKMRPNWQRAAFGHVYAWHDGRLHALAAVALSPGQRFVGRWKIPLTVDGTSSAVTGGLWYAPDPSIVWFWPILVLLLCLWASSRLGIRRLDRFVAAALALSALAAMAVLAIGHQLYGEPFVSLGQEIVLSLILAFVAGGLLQIVLRGLGPFSLILISVAALWAGLDFLPTLLHGFVLTIVPAFVTRAATIVCLSCGVGLLVLLFAFRLADTPEEYEQRPDSVHDRELEDAWESLA